MSEAPETTAPSRSAAALNERIRALWPRAADRPADEHRREYERLLAEWVTAARRGPAVRSSHGD
ncbi:hypothetical protein [Streptomyces sp. RFCAC02]|uniref:hypothetical protein n=1 Tax=Streptomyces sp. RFCAC02 TaxID=2499143 RepID=UPI00101F899E|nr:hypothetical protein [Streptomyces sp. RFCAC02]